MRHLCAQKCIGSLRNGSETLNAILNYAELLQSTVFTGLLKFVPLPNRKWCERNLGETGASQIEDVVLCGALKSTWIVCVCFIVTGNNSNY